jgi:long-subunit fatty acid transport protein
MRPWRNALALALALAPEIASAGGGLSLPRIGGLGPHSPTEADVSAVYWNPAALSLITDKLRLVIDVTYTSARAELQRFVGENGSIPDENTQGQDPVSLTVNLPVPFLGGSFKVNDKLALGAALMVPVGRSGDFIGDCRKLSPAEVDACEKNSPLRYQTTRSAIQSLYFAPTAAYAITPRLSLGAGVNVILSLFASDIAIDASGTEDPNNQAFAHLGAEIIDGIDENGISTDDDGDGVANIKQKPLTGIGFAANVGLYYAATDQLSLGASFSSRTQVNAKGSAVNEATIAGQNVFGTQQGEAAVRYTLPDTINLGAKWRVNERLDIDTYVQYSTYQLHDIIEIDITGMDSDILNRNPQDGLPGTALARQFQNNTAVNLGLNYWTPDRRARVGGAVMYEGSAIPDAAQTASTFDNRKIDAMTYVQYLPNERLRLTLGFGLVAPLAPTDNRGESIFKGTFQGDVDGYECDSQAGNDRETGLCYAVGNGIYSLSFARLGLTTSYSF